LIATGAFWFIPAARIGTCGGFLLGLFVIGAAMTCLETVAHSYATVLGSSETGPTRINIAQTFNGAGWILGAIVAGYFVFPLVRQRAEALDSPCLTWKSAYKDFISRFKAEHFDPVAWAELFKKAGAKYVAPVAEHHDGFAMHGMTAA
jgi:fucose permease